MSLEKYWPIGKEISHCIKDRAESVPDEILLAVHQSFPIAYSQIGPDGKVDLDRKNQATETDLLEYFLSEAPEGSRIVPIEGASGVGKSHLVRILDARIRQLDDADKYLVILIPKSASLRKVVQLILDADPLKSKSYDAVKLEFEKALEDIPLDQAVIQFQAQLEISLRQYSALLKQRIKDAPTDSALKVKLAHAEKLPLLMSDETTVNYFRNIIFPRIVQRTVMGVAPEGDFIAIDPEDGVFKEKDFDLYDRQDDIDFNNASRQVEGYYNLLQSRNGSRRQEAVDVLNDVLDEATRRMYSLHGSLGGMTLGEVILDIRKLLLADEKELVFLVEDFFALVGIQDTLSKVMIQEGVTTEGKIYATIRSAIAVTDGFLAGRDTIATRARRQWFIESRLESDKETLERIRSLVASYINAARLGELELVQSYKANNLENRDSSELWSPPVFGAEDEQSEELKAFGQENGIPLFPFTSESIEYLARRGSTTGGSLVFNPRFVINAVIREILVSGRKAYIDRKFPPPEFPSDPPSGEVAQWLSSLQISEDLRERYKKFIGIWGNNPQSTTDIGRISQKVCKEFSLPTNEFKEVPRSSLIDEPTDKPADKPRPSPVVEPDAVETDAKEKQIALFRESIEAWVQTGQELDQANSRKIRNNLALMFAQRVDWNAERSLKRDITSSMFSIPLARGNQNLSAKAVAIAPNTSDPDGQLRKQLLALFRFFEVYGQKMTYDGVDEDMAVLGNLFATLAPKIIANERSALQTEIALYTQAIKANSNILGIALCGESLTSLSGYIFGETDKIEEFRRDVPVEFSDFRSTQVIAQDLRPVLLKSLLERAGSFQGAGTTPYGLDIAAILESSNEELTNGYLQSLKFDDETKQALQKMSEPRMHSRANKVVKVVERSSADFIEEVGEEFDENEILENLVTLAERIKSSGAWGTTDIGFSNEEYLVICEKFRTSAIKETLAILKSVQMEESEESLSASRKILKTAQIVLEPIVILEEFLSASRAVLGYAENRVKLLESQFEGIDSEKISQDIITTFSEIESELERLKEAE